MIRRPPRSTLFPYTDALPISARFLALAAASGAPAQVRGLSDERTTDNAVAFLRFDWKVSEAQTLTRSEEHTSELQSQSNLVCRLLLEKKKQIHDNRLPSQPRT